MKKPLRFSTETINEDGKMITKYFIDGKPVTEQTYISLQEDQFYGKDNKLKLETDNDVKKLTYEAEYCPDNEYVLSLVNSIRNSDDNTAIELLRQEIEFQAVQAYMQGQIDLATVIARSMKLTARNIQNELDDYLEDNGIDLDDEE